MFFAYAAIFFLLIFLVLYVWDRRRISNGIFLTLGLFSGLLFILYWAFAATASSRSDILQVLVTGLLILLVLLIPFFFFGIIIGLIMNGRTMMRKESRRLANLLPMFLGILFLGLFIWGIAQGLVIGGSPILWLCYFFVLLVISYFTFFFVTFLVSTFIYQYNFPRYHQDFIIVLGSGLIGDKVPPLLASRLDKAMDFYYKQEKKTGKKASFVVSGGKGADELISEASAMRKYLVSKGIPEAYILMEDKSINTLQNMKFSKEKMDTIMDSYRSIFVTNNFHLFRASLYARKAGLKSQGIGSKTALYYMPSALIREFIGIVMMYKFVHLFIVGFLFFVFAVLVFMQLL
ncbi:YdcF family protein [Listeria kieliensis]|uniref:Membrane protein n=1 Tax=Listeria kieliensis TaxID=1621700 RepID=A0A3D8TUF7_9LIST|nr:YdcF family protein [Listeria kieliensis]RDX02287.1 membrane protein [Listeria kieliensis]